MSLAEKRARAEELRTELSALRVEREQALHDGHDDAQEAQLDLELERLEIEKRQATLDLEVAKNGGSVEDAMAAMEKAAAPEVSAVDTSTADLQTALDTPQPEGTSPDEVEEVVVPTPTDQAAVVPLAPGTGEAAPDVKDQEK